MIINKNYAKTMTKHIPCDCKCKLSSQTFNSNQKSNNETCQRECKSYRACKRHYSWNPSTCICANSKYLKSKVDDSKILCDEIIYLKYILSTKIFYYAKERGINTPAI